MKKIVCEVCGGKDFIKEEGIFLCQSCGAKYSLEEARNLMTDVTEEEPESSHSDEDRTKREEKNKKSAPNSKKKIAVIVAAVLVLAVAGILIFAGTASSKCSMDGCSEKKLTNSEYCAEHTCQAEGCYNGAADGEYCPDHICSFEGCSNYVANSGYCKEHTCKIDGCSEGIVKGSSYCSNHKCLESDCKKKSTINGYCDKHALSNSDLPSCLIDYARYYGYSAKEILDTFTYGGVADVESDLNGYQIYYSKRAAGFFLVETEAPYRIFYVEDENGAVFPEWENGAPSVDDGI